MKPKQQALIIILMIYPLSIFAQWDRVTGNNLPDYIAGGWAIDAVPNCAIVSMTYAFNYVYPDTFSLFKSVDNGDNWTEIKPPFYGQQELAMDISIVNKDKYWLATDHGRIISTQDGGKNWTVQFSNSQLTEFMNYIEMFDENNGVAMGDALSDSTKGLILRTKDGGNAWLAMENNNLTMTSRDTWKTIDFVKRDIGFFIENFVGRENQGVFKTTDGGNNWVKIHPPENFGVIKFFDESHGMFFNTNGIGKRTIDGGDTWEDIPFKFIENPSDQTYINTSDIEFVGNSHNNVWAVFGDIIYFSSDFGDTWEKYSFEGNIHFDDMVFVDENIGWLLTRSGIFITNNNGNMLTSVEATEVPNQYKLYQNYPNPFNPTTKISYQIPTSGNVKITIYDLLGNEVSELINENKNAGYHEVDFNANNLSSGVYFYQIFAGNFIQSRKMILLR